MEEPRRFIFMKSFSKCKTLSTNISLSIPNTVKSLEELPPYLTNLKGSPNSFNLSIDYWASIAHTDHGKIIKDFLNGEKVSIATNLLTIVAYKNLVPDANAARDLVDVIFKGKYITINEKINNYLPVKAEIDSESYRIISQINEEHFFQFKDPIKIRVHFKTKLQLHHPVPNISQEELDKGVATAPYADFFKTLRKYLNNPEGVYIFPTKSKNTLGCQPIMSPMITSAPRDLDGVKNLMYQEYMFCYPINLKSLCDFASIFGTQEKSRDFKNIYDERIPDRYCFGFDYEKHSSSYTITFPVHFDSMQNFYDRLQELIEALDEADGYLANMVTVPETEEIQEFLAGSSKIKLRLNYDGDEAHYRKSFHWYSAGVYGVHGQDAQKNFEELKKTVSKLQWNCKTLAHFLGHELFVYYANNMDKIRRPELNEFAFAKISIDPVLYADCGNSAYEKFSKMIMCL